MYGRVLIGACVLIGAAVMPAFAADGGIGGSFPGKGPIRVFVDRVVNASGQGAIDPEAFRKVLKESFAGRKSTRFAVVDSAAGSDITVSATILTYRYLDHGPIKPTSMFAITLVDAAASMAHNYTDMVSYFTVIMTSTGQTLWSGPVEAYVKRDMSPQESVPLIFDKISRRFISQCFGNPRAGSVVTSSRR